MARTYSESGPGYTRTTIPGWDAGQPGGGMAAGGGLAGLSSALDPNLLRDAMLQSLQQREAAFTETMAGKRQARGLAKEEGKRRKETYKTERRRAGRRELEDAPYRRKGLETAQARDIAETQALTGRVPTRTSFVMGAGGFQTPDQLKMTGAQRARFLPGGASLSAQPTRQDLAGLGSDVAFDAMIAGDRQRYRQGSPGF